MIRITDNLCGLVNSGWAVVCNRDPRRAIPMSTFSMLRTVAVLVALTAPARATSSCIPPPSLKTKLRSGATAELYAQIGGWFGERKRFGCAAEAYRSALKLKRDSSRLSYLLGLSLFSGGHPARAVLPLRNSIDIAPDVLQPHIILASALEQLQRTDEAKSEWQTALKIDPHSTLALDGVARALLKEGKFLEVLSLLGPASAPEKLVLDRAEALLNLKGFEEASKLLAESLKENPGSAPLAATLTRLEILQHHTQEAEKIAEANASLHPSDSDVQKVYLQAMVVAGSLQKARSLAPKLLAQFPHDVVLLYLNGVLEHDAGNLQDARRHLEEAVKADPSAAAPRYTLGQVLGQLNDPKSAREQLQRALELGGTEPEIHLELGKVLRALGEQQEAAEQIKLYQQELRVHQTRAIAVSKVAQGDKALAGGDAHRAAGLYREALDITSDDAQLYYKLAVALDELGDLSGETTALERAVQINPDLAVAHNQLGFLASQKGDAAGAESHFREAIRAAPDFTEAWVNLAAILGLQSRFAEAQEAVRKALALDAKNPQALLLRETLAKASAQSRR